jgi:CBS domain-containing membrane protein
MENQEIACMDISDDDIYEAMKDISGYIDITPGDFKEVYRFAYKHALERYNLSIRARDIMTIPVITVKRATSLKEVAQMMADNAISGVPVVDDDGKVGGVISEKDFLLHMGTKGPKTFMTVLSECLNSEGCSAIHIKKEKAVDIMTTPAITVREDTLVLDISKIFREKQINRVPVIDESNRLKGIISRGDIIRSSYKELV